MTNNISVIFFTEVDKIETIIDNIRELGIDVSEFEKSLSGIISDMSVSLAQVESVGYNQQDYFNSIYKAGFSKIDVLLNKIEKYNNYYNAINKCYYIQGSQNFIEVKEEELDKTVDDIINLLNTIKEFDGVIENSKTLLNNLYDFVYILIKMELSLNGKSKLLDYCKNDKTSIYFINKFINKEAQEIRKKANSNKEINSILFRNSEVDTLNSTINEELIQYISVYKDRNKYVKELYELMYKIINDLRSKDSSLSHFYTRENELISKKHSVEEKQKRSKSNRVKKVFSSTLPLVFSLTAIAGLHYGIVRLISGTVYNTDIQTYSSQTGKTVATEDYISKLGILNGEVVDSNVLVEIKEPWEKTGADSNGNVHFERTIKNYEITGVNYDDLTEYIDMDLSAADCNYEYSEKVERKDSITSSDSLTDTDIKVVKQNQDINDSKQGNLFMPWLVNIALFILVDLLAFAKIEQIAEDSGREGPLERILNLKYYLDKLEESKQGIIEWTEELKEIEAEINKIIEENSEIKKRYIELLNNPKYKFFINEYDSKRELINDLQHRMDDSIEKALQLRIDKK